MPQPHTRAHTHTHTQAVVLFYWLLAGIRDGNNVSWPCSARVLSQQKDGRSGRDLHPQISPGEEISKSKRDCNRSADGHLMLMCYWLSPTQHHHDSGPFPPTEMCLAWIRLSFVCLAGETSQTACRTPVPLNKSRPLTRADIYTTSLPAAAVCLLFSCTCPVVFKHPLSLHQHGTLRVVTGRTRARPHEKSALGGCTGWLTWNTGIN